MNAVVKIASYVGVLFSGMCMMLVLLNGFDVVSVCGILIGILLAIVACIACGKE